jgi:uncharacterized Ntn-hydrolase superfamily protein
MEGPVRDNRTYAVICQSVAYAKHGDAAAVSLQAYRSRRKRLELLLAEQQGAEESQQGTLEQSGAPAAEKDPVAVA